MDSIGNTQCATVNATHRQNIL